MKQETQHYNYDWKSAITVGTVEGYCINIKHPNRQLSKQHTVGW